MTKAQLQAIRERCNAATPGPWRVADYTSEECPGAYWITGPDYVEDGDYSLFTIGDATFLAHARTDIPALLDYIEKLEAVAEAAREHRNECNRIGEYLLNLGRPGDKKELVKERMRTGNNIGVTAQKLDEALAALDD